MPATIRIRASLSLAVLAASIPVLADGTLSMAVATDAVQYPAYLLEVPESVSQVLIADAEAATLWRFDVGGTHLAEGDQRYMSIGQNGVGKKRAWDRKTPLGIYFITEQLDTTRMHEKYGAAAFPLDYPNAWDRHNSHTGDGIWLHGVDRRNPERPARDTDGCLAVRNEELLKLAETLEPHITPVIVAREMTWASRAELESRRVEFRSSLDAWRSSQERGDLLTYLSFYADDFSSRGMEKAEWSTYRMNVFESRKLDTIELADILLVADPEEPDLYLSRFTQILQTDTGAITTTKRLYWRRQPDNAWRIVAEGAG